MTTTTENDPYVGQPEIAPIVTSTSDNLATIRSDGLTVNVYWFTDSDGEQRLIVDVLTGEEDTLRYPVRVYVNDENGLAAEQIDPDEAVAV